MNKLTPRLGSLNLSWSIENNSACDTVLWIGRQLQLNLTLNRKQWFLLFGLGSWLFMLQVGTEIGLGRGFFHIWYLSCSCQQTPFLTKKGNEITYSNPIKGVYHPWTLFLKTLCIFSKCKATLDKVLYRSGQKCNKELKNYSFTSVETIVVNLQSKMCENQYFPCFEP